MIRQAHTYLAGAVSGTILIAVAVIAFVVLVSAQAFKSWPIPGLGADNDGSVSIEAAQPVSGRPGPAVAPAQPATSRGSSTVDKATGDDAAPSRSTSIAPQESASTGTAGAPNAPGKSPGGSGTSGGAGGGGAPSQPAANSTGSSGSSQSGGAIKTPTEAVTKPPSETVTKTVDEAVDQVDQTLGGTLSETGVTKATKGLVERAAGTNSALGQVLNETAGAVGGLLGPGD